jgi:hypothetical protein
MEHLECSSVKTQYGKLDSSNSDTVFIGFSLLFHQYNRLIVLKILNQTQCNTKILLKL